MERERVLLEQYEKINNILFQSSLPGVFFTITNGQKNRSGWKVSMAQNQLYEITVARARLEDPEKDIFSNLFHQIVHIINSEHGIGDTSRYGQYHKRSFKKTGDKIGLTVYQNKNGYGFCDVVAPDELIKKVKLSDFQKHLKEAVEKDEIAANYKTVTFCCPLCKRTAKAEFEMKLYCGYCNVEMIRKLF